LINDIKHLLLLLIIMTNNLNYSVFEPEIDNAIESTTYDDIMKEVEEEEKKQTNSTIMFGEVTLDDITALEIEYDTNYIKKELIKIAEYYEISIRKKNKKDLISEIVIFETSGENIAIVERRKELWFYINEIREDKYLSKYLIFD
tara:strand:- start:926 stop:1360 length:435 start_codon:yes stop_codon:yes gene_type:complete